LRDRDAPSERELPLNYRSRPQAPSNRWSKGRTVSTGLFTWRCEPLDQALRSDLTAPWTNLMLSFVHFGATVRHSAER
jgi:hypothetical protein